MFTHNISPILFEVGGLEIRYYGVMFAVGVLLAYLILGWIWKREKFAVKDFDSLVIWLFVGMVVGARLGHIVFYNLDYYMANPGDIIKIWEGGLASHGAAIGVFLAYLGFWLVKRFKFHKYADAAVIVFPLVAGFVRIGNFFNSEIVGRPTEVPWGVVFALRGEDFARHPSQLYESATAFLIFAIMMILYKKYFHKAKPFFFLFTFMGLYFVTRFLIEFVKEYHTLDGGLTMGQWLSVIPVILAGVYYVWLWSSSKTSSS